jgi:membrane dipeptidase
MSTRRVCSVLVLIAALLWVSWHPAGAQPAGEQAREVADEVLIFDGHVDTLFRLSRLYEDISQPADAVDVDVPRARDGGLNAVFMAVYVPSSLQSRPGDAFSYANGILDIADRVVDETPPLRRATSPGQVRAIVDDGDMALALSMENAAGLGGDLDALAHFYDRGVRSITLLHADHNRLGDASYDRRPPRWGGLSPFGREVVREMNRLGMLVDVSHASDATARDVLETSSAPVIASHSSCRRFTPGWQRNLSDELIRRIAEGGGVVLITFGSNFLRPEYRAEEGRIREATYGYIEAQGWPRSSPEAIRHRHRQRTANPVGSVADVADHIDHAVSVAGIDHVGIGSDFDGIFALPAGLQDAADYPNLVAELLRRGYERDDLEAIFGGNLLRVWREVGG